MLLTVLLVTQAAVVSLDLIAAQCLAPGVAVPGERGAGLAARDVPGAPAASGWCRCWLLIYVLHRISCVAWEAGAATPRTRRRRRRTRGCSCPARTWSPTRTRPTLRALHLVAALATVALLPLGGPFPMPARRCPPMLWVLALALLVVALLGVLLLDDPSGADAVRAGRWLRAALRP